MFFTRTHEFSSPFSKDEIKKRLLGKHVKIHNLDFEVIELDYMINIIPHAEQVTEIKTLPITELDFKDDNGKTRVVIRSKMRKLDEGGPQLIVIFCIFLLLASVILFLTSGDRMITMSVFGVFLITFSAFMFRMQTGYLDYVRKIRSYVKNKGIEVA
jgi:hypothetical protein